MKLAPILLLPFLITASLLQAEDGPEKQKKKAPGLHVGTAAVDVSPIVFPMQLRSGASDYVHDPLHARAIALENGNGRVVITLLDAIGIGRELADEVKETVAQATGWRPEEMLISGTHTHSAPKGGTTSEGRIAYEARRKEGLIAAMTQAIQSLEPAKIGYASDEEPSEVFNRRWYLKPGTMDPNPFGKIDQVKTNAPREHLLEPAGPTDPEICVIDLRSRRNHRALGIIANYSLHYVGGIPTVRDPTGKVIGMASADYYGEFARVMPYRVAGSNPPENFVAMMTNGTSGDINNIDFYGNRPPRAPYEQIRIVAAKAADTAWRAVKKIEAYDDDPLIAMLQREVEVSYRHSSPEEIAAAQAILALPKAEQKALHPRAVNYANTVLAYAEPNRTEKIILQAIRLGGQAIVSFPCEVFVETGLEIKAKSPFANTFAISLANGGYGYLPTPRHHKLGGYETWLGTSKFVPETSDLLTERLLEMLEELHSLTAN